jgi:hypothetical protein
VSRSIAACACWGYELPHSCPYGAITTPFPSCRGCRLAKPKMTLAPFVPTICSFPPVPRQSRFATPLTVQTPVGVARGAGERRAGTALERTGVTGHHTVKPKET